MNFKLNTISAVLSSAVLVTALSGCTSNDDTQNTTEIAKPAVEAKLFGPQQNMQGSQAAALGNNQWLMASESQGLLLTDNEKSRVLLAGNFESISLKQLSAQQFIRRYVSLKRVVTTRVVFINLVLRHQHHTL